MAHCQFSIYLHLLWQMLSNLILALLFYRNRLAPLCYTIIIRIISPINSPCPFLIFDDCKPAQFQLDPHFLQKLHFWLKYFIGYSHPKGDFFFKVWDNRFQPSWLRAEWINAFSLQKIHNALSWVCAYDIFLTTYWIAFSSFLRLNGRPRACGRILPYVMVESLKIIRKKEIQF